VRNDATMRALMTGRTGYTTALDRLPLPCDVSPDGEIRDQRIFCRVTPEAAYFLANMGHARPGQGSPGDQTSRFEGGHRAQPTRGGNRS
jgi:hypothetical protein